MSHDLERAVFNRLAQRQVTATLRGGCWAGRAPRADATGQPIAFPYAVYTVVASAPRLWTTHSAFVEELAQWVVYDRSKQAVFEHLATIRAALGFAPLVLSGTEEVVELRPLGEVVQIDAENEGVWQGVAQYRVLSRRPVEYRPE